jgi:23S rRNA (cytidine1920-2'-O)/16S rRNA (cytidine1409-2'-O)-methyltransferase
MAARRALREEIVRRGLADVEDVNEVLATNRVRVNGAVVANGASLVAASDSIAVIAPPARFVSRGGLKLEGALEHFGIDVSQRLCLDAGSSTGGFTDCLLQRGAQHVIAVDVGRAQLHHKMATDGRVTSWESTNILAVDGDKLAGVSGYETGAGVVVADLSFTSSAQIARHLVELAAPGADLVILVKPQFEAPRADVPVGGVVVDESVRLRAIEAVEAALAGGSARVVGRCESPITGTEGNREYFVWAKCSTVGSQ